MWMNKMLLSLNENIDKSSNEILNLSIHWYSISISMKILFPKILISPESTINQTSCNVVYELPTPTTWFHQTNGLTLKIFHVHPAQAISSSFFFSINSLVNILTSVIPFVYPTKGIPLNRKFLIVLYHRILN